MKTRLLISLLAVATALLVALPATDASAASCVTKGYKLLDQSKYVSVLRGPIPKGDSTSERGYYACRIKTGKRYVLGGDDCFGNTLGSFGLYDLSGNYIAYDAHTCGDPEGESDAKRLNVATGAKASFSAEHEPLPGGGVQDHSITDILVRANGDMAWIARTRRIGGDDATRYDVRVSGDPAIRVDFGSDIVPDSLAYSGNRIFWLNGGTAKSASL